MVPSTDDGITLAIPQGGSAVLECNTKDDGRHYTLLWFPKPDNINRKLLSNGNLFISSFQLGINKTEDSCFCLLLYQDSRKQRLFTLVYDESKFWTQYDTLQCLHTLMATGCLVCRLGEWIRRGLIKIIIVNNNLLFCFYIISNEY